MRKEKNLKLHMIGKLQSNKAKDAVKVFDYIHSLDSIKLAKKNCIFYEVPISYAGRSYLEGKKIGIKDAFRAIYCILKYAFKK